MKFLSVYPVFFHLAPKRGAADLQMRGCSSYIPASRLKGRSDRFGFSLWNKGCQDFPQKF